MKKFSNSGQFSKGFTPWNKGLKKKKPLKFSTCKGCSIEFVVKGQQKGLFCTVLCLNKSRIGTNHNHRTNNGNVPWNKGMKGLMSGINSPHWIFDRSLIKGKQDRNNPEYKQWRKQVWLRDKFTCRIADNNCDGKIEAHHILRWSEFPELRYQLNNGITLCHAHHPTKRAEEKRLIPTFQELVSVSK